MMSIIDLYGYEEEQHGAKMYKMVQKEYDRAKKRVVDEEKEHIEKHGGACEICKIRIQQGDSALLLKKGLLCQDCYRPIGIIHWNVKALKDAIKYIEKYEKR